MDYKKLMVIITISQKKTGKDDVVKAYEAVASQLKSDNSVIEKTISSGMKLVGKSPYVYGGGAPMIR